MNLSGTQSQCALVSQLYMQKVVRHLLWPFVLNFVRVPVAQAQLSRKVRCCVLHRDVFDAWMPLTEAHPGWLISLASSVLAFP